MINNRQNGRRRGRGGGPRAPSGAGVPGNRQENRSRGNASQLHEKYKALARDTQLAGDRVQTEYYLQFADHYFRVLSENRPRFEEQRRSRDEYSDDEDDQDEMAAGDDGDREDRDERPAREPRFERERRPEPRARDEEARPRRTRAQPDRDAADRNGRGNDDGEDGERISLDSLPPAIAADSEAGERTPRRRTRRPRTDNDDTEIAPAA